ncbi:hypothetical protein PGT21_034981 [Puccinia graminis f. sp. tritici]|uniref:Uncharacterized protein n=1 Tax=Puccinia graminis f. sp. tritici TaxID=56615 RepID=A0A5B0QCL1_PUCGR|nr:hypothetical protein PGT21_034981 [Puccinia graminis f. sp. tritici]
MNTRPTQTTSAPRRLPAGFPGNTFDHPFVIDRPTGFPGNTFDHPFVIDRPTGFPGNTFDHPFVIDRPTGFPGNTFDHPFVIGQIHIYCTDAAFPRSSTTETAVEEAERRHRNDFVVYHRMASMAANIRLPRIAPYTEVPESSITIDQRQIHRSV